MIAVKIPRQTKCNQEKYDWIIWTEDILFTLQRRLLMINYQLF